MTGATVRTFDGQKFIKAFISGGRLGGLGEISQNFIVKNYVPEIEVLKYTKLFNTYGGMYSTNEGLYCGVPLIVIPQNADQPIISGQVTNIGASIQFQRQSLTADQLYEAADPVLNGPSFQKATTSIKESVEKSGEKIRFTIMGLIFIFFCFYSHVLSNLSL
ncbi:hypothetical protein ACZ11_06935 [Lysinibacillus xylanilyticus]|uniref:Erythromycin biosynthesis protein CIII-like C-terminal domain-containing protein n=1 Tax=Lysinibacillus xylanilyticus TaxID=582475 RepID=A0A0K9FBD8_9BACI|nr:hypothetical protein ACZ11_06935 [Lysinibacillus xylanilyticus]